jgi:adenine C2-methylase RlmN of 23S rRNA A2503 and tRNA A37
MRDMLVTNGFVTVVRNSRGRDIHAACGQLRATANPGKN